MKIKKLLLTGLAILICIASTKAQNVNIPDANFKAALVANASINTNMDTEIQVSEASVFNGAINVSQLYIGDLTGIEAFGLIYSLDCSLNQISGLNVSANTALTYLNCGRYIDLSGENGMDYNFFGESEDYESLDVSANSLLTTLICSGIRLLSLNTTGLTALTYLDCSFNKIQTLNVSANTALTYIDCSSNFVFTQVGSWKTSPGLYYVETPTMNSLDVSSNTALTTLKCNDNGLFSLNVSGANALTILNCSNTLYNDEPPSNEYNSFYHNNLISLDVSSCTALTTLDFSGNYSIASLDVSGCTALTTLSYSFGPYQPSNELTSLDVSGCTALTNLNCINNQLTSLDVSTCTALISLECSHNQLASLDVSACTALTNLDCRNNSLTSLDVSANTSLTTLYCSGNNLASLDVSACTALTTLYCSGNNLASLDVSACTAFTTLNCSYNQLTSLNVKNGNNINMFDIQDFYGYDYPAFLAYNNPNLSCIEVDNVAWSTSNWSNYIDATASFSLNCSGAGILDINESNALIFYPNPTTGNLFLSEKGDVALSDLSGKLLLEEKNANQLDISSLPAGIYFLHFGENTKQTFKVIKE